MTFPDLEITFAPFLVFPGFPWSWKSCKFTWWLQAGVIFVVEWHIGGIGGFNPVVTTASGSGKPLGHRRIWTLYRRSQRAEWVDLWEHWQAIVLRRCMRLTCVINQKSNDISVILNIIFIFNIIRIQWSGKRNSTVKMNPFEKSLLSSH